MEGDSAAARWPHLPFCVPSSLVAYRREAGGRVLAGCRIATDICGRACLMEGHRQILPCSRLQCPGERLISIDDTRRAQAQLHRIAMAPSLAASRLPAKTRAFGVCSMDAHHRRDGRPRGEFKMPGATNSRRATAAVSSRCMVHGLSPTAAADSHASQGRKSHSSHLAGAALGCWGRLGSALATGR